MTVEGQSGAPPTSAPRSLICGQQPGLDVMWAGGGRHWEAEPFRSAEPFEGETPSFPTPRTQGPPEGLSVPP